MWITVRNNGKKRLEEWHKDSRLMLEVVDRIIRYIPFLETPEAFTKHLETHTEPLPDHLKMEVRRLVMTSLYGGTIEVETEEE